MLCSLSQFLSEGDQQARQQQEITTLEQTLTLHEKMHHRNVNDRKETIKNIKRLIRRKEKENEQLDADLEELALSVAERRNVNEANGEQHAVLCYDYICFSFSYYFQLLCSIWWDIKFLVLWSVCISMNHRSSWKLEAYMSSYVWDSMEI